MTYGHHFCNSVFFYNNLMFYEHYAMILQPDDLLYRIQSAGGDPDEIDAA
jgi:hypothetical protein